MAPESTYTSSYSQNPTPSSNAQLSVLRHELRQREELISRLVDDISSIKSTLKGKDEEMAKKFKKFAIQEYHLVMVTQLQKSERMLKKQLKKAEKRAQGTYDGDLDDLETQRMQTRQSPLKLMRTQVDF
ncbi:unnamed protein product [Oikopleura dioica]|uniref:Uncharacterized protein n=1 Tax=Oikopleura dioica TaxID=34765 RepID=E4WT30_OIKDI|nr:unnamed protein product [Oikopleura dioica]